MLADALAVCCSGANPSAHSQSCAHDERWFHSLRQTGGDHDSAPICTRSHTVLLQKTSEVRTGEARGYKILPPWAHRQDGVKACRQSTFQWCCTQNWRGLDEGSAPRDVGLGLASPCRRALRPAGAYATATYTIDGCKKACLRPAKSLHAIGTAVFSGAPWTLAHGKIPVSFGLQTEELSTVGSKLDQVLARLPPPSATPAIGAGYGHDGNGAGNGGGIAQPPRVTEELDGETTRRWCPSLVAGAACGLQCNGHGSSGDCHAGGGLDCRTRRSRGASPAATLYPP